MSSRLVAAMSLCVAATATTVTGEAIAAPSSKSQQLPKLIVRSPGGTNYSGIKPRVIAFSGDAGNIVTGINWRHWNHTNAAGRGTSDLQGCVPNCAQGSETPVTTTVTLSRPRTGHFTKIVEVRDGHTLVGYYGHSSWPEGA
jgi:hypothetical protein